MVVEQVTGQPDRNAVVGVDAAAIFAAVFLDGIAADGGIRGGLALFRAGKINAAAVLSGRILQNGVARKGDVSAAGSGNGDAAALRSGAVARKGAAGDGDRAVVTAA